MRKIRIIEHISLDGVIQAPGGPNEDGDYPYGGWAVPHHDPAVGEAIVRIFALSPETLPSESLCKRLRAALDACPVNQAQRKPG